MACYGTALLPKGFAVIRRRTVGPVSVVQLGCVTVASTGNIEGDDALGSGNALFTVWYSIVRAQRIPVPKDP